MIPITKTPGFGTIHQLLGLFEKVVLKLVGGIPTHLLNVYDDWSVTRAGSVVLVLHKFLSDASFHTGHTPSWT
jgi:hypothetical protein